MRCAGSCRHRSTNPLPNQARSIESPRSGSEISASLFQPPIAVFHLHWPAHMNLNADQPLGGAIRQIVVQHDAHHMPVQSMDQGIAADDQVDGVPIAGDERGQVLGLSKSGKRSEEHTSELQSLAY